MKQPKSMSRHAKGMPKSEHRHFEDELSRHKKKEAKGVTPVAKISLPKSRKK